MPVSAGGGPCLDHVRFNAKTSRRFFTMKRDHSFVRIDQKKRLGVVQRLKSDKRRLFPR
jgi:hypothetical protein